MPSLSFRAAPEPARHGVGFGDYSAYVDRYGPNVGVPGDYAGTRVITPGGTGSELVRVK